ncbi:hypothetical protein [Flavobacterium sp. SM2513]|uniref:hypothetical protein n=1 Tax=Flavobacterium sp. SM2513 TaxID=3424766 RepID=UPI003D7FF444
MQTNRNGQIETASKDLNAEVPEEEKENFQKDSSIAASSLLHQELTEDLSAKEFVEQQIPPVLNAASADKVGAKGVEAFNKRDFNLTARYESSNIVSTEEDLSWMQENIFKAHIPTALLSPYEETGWTLLKDNE